MNVTSNLLGDIGRANAKSSPSPQENLLQLPPALLLTMQPGFALEQGSNASFPGTIFQNGGSFTILATVTNAGPVTFAGPIIPQGIWEIFYHSQFSCTYTNFAAIGFFDLVNGAASKRIILGAWTAPGAQVTETSHAPRVISISEQFQFEVISNVAPAAQTWTVTIACVVKRLV